jgi:hypothetical protein
MRAGLTLVTALVPSDPACLASSPGRVTRTNFTARQRGLLGVARQLARLRRQPVEDVVDEGVEDGHAALGDARVGVHLLEHLVDVRARTTPTRAFFLGLFLLSS